MRRLIFLTIFPFFCVMSNSQNREVSLEVMNQIYEEIKTPYKYGLILVPKDNKKMVDSPSIFRHKDTWYMIYIVFDGAGYETWMAQSNNLLQWKNMGKIMSYSTDTWDANQKAGYIALQDFTWNGSYKVEKYEEKYWMSYLGGTTKGYEAGILGIGIAYSSKLDKAKEWHKLTRPVLFPEDEDARWYDNGTIYKSSIIHDKSKTLGYSFVMFYNAKNKKTGDKEVAERIAIAVSDNMTDWKRYGNEPVINHHSGISGDAFITKIDDVWVMFYFGAFWKPNAFERFACSYDLVNWTLWEGDDLIAPSEPYDDIYAHKPCVIKHNDIVYHFYCAVNKNGERSIALATSRDLGKSNLQFPN